MKISNAIVSAILVVAVVIGIAAAVPSGVVAQGVAQPLRSITVTGDGDAAGAPDQAQVNAGVQTMAPTVADASRQNQAIVEQILAALAEQGIDAKHIQTANYSIWPEQHHDARGSGEVTITGYRVNNTVNVTIEDIEKVGKVLAAVTNAGANTIHGVNFGVKDTAALEERARAAAMKDARARAESLAELAGVELGEVLSISTTSQGNYPMPMMAGGRMAMMEAAPTPGISPGQLSVSAQVHVSWAIR